MSMWIIDMIAVRVVDIASYVIHDQDLGET